MTRLSCLVPFCRRTTAPGRFAEWICAKHWRLVAPDTKARRRAADRLVRKAKVRQHRALPALEWRAARAWEACKREAIEKAFGI